MPRYLVTAPFPSVLDYKSARFRFEKHQGLSGQLYWHVRKDGPGYRHVIICQGRTEDELERVRTSPITTQAGSAVDKVLRRLVKDGLAAELPGERDHGDTGARR